MKLVFFDVEGWERETFKVLEGDHEVICREESLRPDNVSC